MSFRYKILIFFGFFRTLGLVQTIKLYIKRAMGNKKITKIHPYGYKYPIYIRPGTSDFYCFFQVISSKGYRINSSLKATTIIDGGSNIGLTTVYFKNLYPESFIIAIEPENSNYELLQENTKTYENIICLQNGIWNKSCFLKIINSQVDNWAFRVEESNAPTDIRAISISEIIKKYDIKSIDILKLDIEGSEKQIFSNDFKEWLPIVNLLMIEIHDSMIPGCSMALFKALDGYNYSVNFQGETLIITFNHSNN